MSEYLYGDYVKKIHSQFERQLSQIATEFNFDLGDEFEVAVCKLLRMFLPDKYGICRGFLVNKHGTTAGDDIIIYDQGRFPTLRSVGKENYAQKEFIPIEAAYAYIEAKHTLNFEKDGLKDTIVKAFHQCVEVKKLCIQREKNTLDHIDPYRRFAGESLFESSDDALFPEYRNPFVTIVISRYVAENNNRISNRLKINDLLDKSPLCNPKKTDTSPLYRPDLVVAGPSNLMLPAIDTNDGFQFQLLMLEKSKYGIVSREKIAFGYFLAHLSYILDWIRLYRMPWGEILEDAAKHIDSGK